MTLKEALTVIDLNKDKLSGSMQLAVKTVCLEITRAYEKGRDETRLKYLELLHGRFQAVEAARKDNYEFGFDTAADDALLAELKGILEELDK